jgi:diaminopimelate epimerase
MESVNINFCHVESRKDLRIVTCEFGAGVTLACGTGSTTSAYVGFATGLLEKEVNVHTKGGLLVINS